MNKNESLGKLKIDEVERQAKLLAEQHFIRSYEKQITNLKSELYITRILLIVSSLFIFMLLARGF